MGTIASNRVTSNFKDSFYTGFDNKQVMRPGSEDNLLLPSLVGSKRVYRDGRVESVK
jgi:hypothetical protein|tara:strand:+ start:143 stop:313 length:171 start_codon:yes stop_codon:yes gene_type:complete